MSTRTTGLRWLGQPLVVTMAALLTACADGASLGPKQPSPDQPFASASDDASVYSQPPQLGACDVLAVPAGSRLVLHTHATGTQIYRWTGASWSFVAPSAVLYANAESRGIIGTHFAGPTWESNSGSAVVGTVLTRCTPEPNAIPWLLLGAVSAEGPGIFHRVAFIQRVNTVGGNAPITPGTVVGEEIGVPYAADYYFYRTS